MRPAARQVRQAGAQLDPACRPVRGQGPLLQGTDQVPITPPSSLVITSVVERGMLLPSLAG
ncbi:hypothetical protein M2D07_028065, partial [Pseudomonas sp. BGr12]|uniref:hypothetical protein n=1 Tax=Pseudomonas sp. BGr12 TaxID=2936269 RepID=UPI00255A1B32